MEVKKFYLEKIAALQECMVKTNTRTNDALNGLEAMIGVIERQSSTEIMAFLEPFLTIIKTTVTEMDEKAQEIGMGKTK